MLFIKRVLKKKYIYIFTKIISSTTDLSIDNNNKYASWAPNQHIGMISEGSCDSKDWHKKIQFWNLLNYVFQKYNS